MQVGRFQKKYVGIFNDKFGGMTDSGKVVRDGWIFGLIPETETCEGWLGQGMMDLWAKTSEEWDKYGFLVSNLPPEIRERFDRIQGEALERAKSQGWNPEQEFCEDS